MSIKNQQGIVNTLLFLRTRLTINVYTFLLVKILFIARYKIKIIFAPTCLKNNKKCIVICNTYLKTDK